MSLRKSLHPHTALLAEKGALRASPAGLGTPEPRRGKRENGERAKTFGMNFGSERLRWNRRETAT